jgi:hypothetical protein
VKVQSSPWMHLFHRVPYMYIYFLCFFDSNPVFFCC